MTAQGSVMGRKRSKTGSAAEAVFELVSRTWDKGLRLWKIPRGLRVIGGKGGKLRSVPAEKTGPDYLGVCQGQSIAVEVKSCGRGNLPFSAFDDHQIADLTDHEKRGGASFAAAVTRGAVYMVPWSVVLQWMNEEDGSSVPKMWVEQFRAKAGWSFRSA
jgi:hypothetical protein